MQKFSAYNFFMIFLLFSNGFELNIEFLIYDTHTEFFQKHFLVAHISTLYPSGYTRTCIFILKDFRFGCSVEI
jgi:hypothetical protein